MTKTQSRVGGMDAIREMFRLSARGREGTLNVNLEDEFRISRSLYVGSVLQRVGNMKIQLRQCTIGLTNSDTGNLL